MNHGKKNESEKVFQVAQVPLGAEVLKICGPMKQTQEELMHAWQESQKQGGEIGISGSRVDGIRSLPPAHTHQKLEVISLSELRYEKEDSHIKYIK